MPNPREVPPASNSRFVLGVFTDIRQAELTLDATILLSNINRAVMRASGIILDSHNYDGTEISEYARSVMADQEVTLQDIEDIKAVIAEMQEFEKEVDLS